jgi:hypothetical protein
MTIVKSVEELIKLYNEEYEGWEHHRDDDPFDIYVSYYILDLEALVITEYTQSGDIMCGCDVCYFESYDVVARVE